jgi:hypothetical protein
VSWQSERGRVAALTRSREPDDPELVAARRRLHAEFAADDVRRAVDDPAELARAARIVRAAIARRKLALDLTSAEPEDGAA